MEEKHPHFKIIYFSGTGSTAMAAECFYDLIKQRGCMAELEAIAAGTPHTTSPYDMLILLYPVHAFNAPESVYRWIRNAGAAEKIPAAVISVSGGGEISPNTACRMGAIQRLEKMGYTVTYENMIVMPSNCLVPTRELLSAMLLKVLPEKASQMIDQILSGERRRTAPLLADRILSALGEMEKPFANLFGKGIKVFDHCSGCGWCSLHCPAGNIQMAEGKPRFDGKCNACLKCIYGCPQRALMPRFAKSLIIKGGYRLGDWRKKVPEAEGLPVDELAKGIAWIGVKKYLHEKNVEKK